MRCVQCQKEVERGKGIIAKEGTMHRKCWLKLNNMEEKPRVPEWGKRIPSGGTYD